MPAEDRLVSIMYFMFSNWRLIPAALFLVLFISCGITGEDEFTETYTFDAYNQSAILSDTTSWQVAPDSVITVYSFSIGDGSNLVFEYGRSVHPPENILDAGLNETLVFQITEGLDTFAYSGIQLAEGQIFYRRGCFCPESGAGFKATEGFIEGERLSANLWFVRADVLISGYRQNYRVQFEHTFRIIR